MPLTHGAGSVQNTGKSKASRHLLPIAYLQGSHYEILINALSNVLSSQVALTTYGQILYGLPLSSVAMDVSEGALVCAGHPLLDEHLQLAPDVVAKTEELRASVPLDTFEVDASTVRDYQAASPGSRAFQTRLVELVARTVHAIAVWLYKTQSPLCPKDELAYQGQEEYPPTFFVHPWYAAYDQYPDGLADGVGYWAEDRILGGVVLFDRRPPDAPDTIYKASFPHEPVALAKQADAIYFHTNARAVFYRIYRLRDEQKRRLLRFLLAGTDAAAASCPLPIHGDAENLVRVDPEEPMKETGIYRDKWERAPLKEDELDRRIRDVIDTFNFVSQDEWYDANVRGSHLRERLWDGEDLGW